MLDNGDNGMHMEGYSFMGMHYFWWVSILIFAMLLLVVAHRYRNRK